MMMAEQYTASKSSSAVASVGTGLGNAVRMMQGKQGKRLLGALFAGGSSMFQTAPRVLRMLFLQVMGFLFLAVAVFIGSKAFHEYRLYTSGQGPASRAYLAIFFTIMFGYFGLSSFWRARK